jgi:hypothetical protein
MLLPKTREQLLNQISRTFYHLFLIKLTFFISKTKKMEEPTSERIRREDSVNNPVRWFKMLVSFAYLAVGVYILFFDKTLNEGINQQIRYIFGGLATIYGVYRAYRAYVDHW